MVAGFQEELDELDLIPSPAARVHAARPAPPDSSDDERPPPPPAAVDSPGRRRRDARLVASPTPDESIASVTTVESEPEHAQPAEPESGTEPAKIKKKKKKDKEKDKEVGGSDVGCLGPRR